MNKINEETRNSLIAEAKKYGADEFELFTAELGWQDWMNAYTEAEEGEEITEKEASEIDKDLKAIFKEAHEA